MSPWVVAETGMHLWWQTWFINHMILTIWIQNKTKNCTCAYKKCKINGERSPKMSTKVIRSTDERWYVRFGQLVWRLAHRCAVKPGVATGIFLKMREKTNRINKEVIGPKSIWIWSLGRRPSRPNISGNTRGQFSPPGRAEGPAPLPPIKMTDLVPKVVAIASYLGECPLKMCWFSYLVNVTKYGAIL